MLRSGREIGDLSIVPLGGAPKLDEECGKVKHPPKSGVFRGFCTYGPPCPLTPRRGLGYLFKLVIRRRYPMDRAARDEADIQASKSQAEEQARLPRAHEDPGGSQDHQPATQAGAGSAHGQGRREEVGPAARGPGESLPRSARIRRSNEIRALLERGKRKRTENVDVFFAPSPVSHSRLGLIVPKHGKRIVDRNLLKRRLREIGRRQLLASPVANAAPADILIRARRRAYQASFEELAQEVRGAVEVLWSDES